MQDKLSRHSSQNDLLTELNNLQKDMITMMLSMLEGNVINGTSHSQIYVNFEIIVFIVNRYHWKTDG